jgi:hypothetical protein
MNIWLKRIGLFVIGYVLSKIIGEVTFQLLYSDEISTIRAYVPATLSAIVLGYFIYLAFKAK